MNSAEQFILAIVGIANFGLGAIVLARNSRLKSSKSFAALTVAIMLWCVGLITFYSADTIEGVISSARWFYIAALWMNTFLLMFTVYFTHLEKIRRFILLPIAASLLFTLYILLSEEFFIESVSLNGGERVNVSLNTPSYSMYIALIIGYFIVNLIAFAKRYIDSRGQEKSKFGVMLLGFSVAGIFASFFNVYLPLIDDYSLIWVGPIFTLGFVSLFAYAMLRFKLFDIRLVVAKSIGYVLTLIFLVVIPIAIASLVYDEWLTSLTSIARAAAIALFYISLLSVYTPLKRVFDRFTGRIFYRDSYSSSDVLDKIANITVSEFQIDNLISKSVHELFMALKPSTVRFILLDSDGQYYSDYSSGNAHGKLKSADAIQYIQKQYEQQFFVEEFESEKDEALKSLDEVEIFKYLKNKEIKASIRLSTKDEDVAYMVLGEKLSGNLYSQQDKDLLSIAANEMAVAIQNARRFDEIKRFNETLRLEVERATKELRDSNEKLQALDQAKDEFVSMASHQLRTPLTSVKGYLSMILEGDVGKVDKKQRDMLAAAFTSSQRMVYLIADLLNVSRLQTGKFVIEPQLSDLPSVVESEIDQLKETAKAKKLKVKYNKPKQFPTVYIDETKTRQVIMNFIDNAIYYTPNGGNIEITLSANDKKIEYTVKDNGIGVPRIEQKNMFTKFYRATNAKKARPDGTGLGLFMARKVIVDQGGAVIFQSKEGEGSTFGFTFPLSRVRPPKDKMKQLAESKKSNPPAKKPKRKK